MDEKDFMKLIEKTEEERKAVELRNSFADGIEFSRELYRRADEGKLTEDEMQKIHENFVAGQVKDFFKKGDWENVKIYGETIKAAKPLIFGELFDYIPPNYQRELALRSYMIDGFTDMNVIRSIRKLERVGKNGLPKSLKKKETIVVYRAGEEEPSEASERLSWTTSYSTALFFFSKHPLAHAKYLFKAEIDPEDVIAYIKDRNENEILQYKSVKNITVMKINKEFEMARARYQAFRELGVRFDI